MAQKLEAKSVSTGLAVDLTEEADSLWSRVVEAHWDADEAEKAFEALSARSQRDDEEDA